MKDRSSKQTKANLTFHSTIPGTNGSLGYLYPPKRLYRGGVCGCGLRIFLSIPSTSGGGGGGGGGGGEQQNMAGVNSVSSIKLGF
jgi:hypothetical protein